MELGDAVYGLADAVVGYHFSIVLLCKTSRHQTFFLRFRKNMTRQLMITGGTQFSDTEQHSCHPVFWSCDKCLITSFKGALQKKPCVYHIFFLASFSSVCPVCTGSLKRLRWESAHLSLKPRCPAGKTCIVSCHVGYESLHSRDTDSPQKSPKYNAIMCKQTVSWYVPDATFITAPWYFLLLPLQSQSTTFPVRWPLLCCFQSR